MTTTKSPEETEALGERLGSTLLAGDVITLHADLGGGKTTLVRGICRGLAIDESAVSSPTFVIQQIYEGRLPVYHFDAYRLNSSRELLEIGAEDFFWGQGVSLIEWPELALPLLPPDRLEISLELGDSPDERHITLTPHGSWDAKHC